MDLRPSSLDDLGLVPTLNWLIRDFGAAHPELSLNAEVDVEEDRIAPPLKVVVYRIVKETLEAIAGRGEASTVTIRLAVPDGVLVLQVEDDGMRYHPERPDGEEGTLGDLGLAGVKERAVLSGGEFRLVSNKLGGTISEASWLL